MIYFIFSDPTVDLINSCLTILTEMHAILNQKLARIQTKERRKGKQLCNKRGQTGWALRNILANLVGIYQAFIK